MEHPDLGSVRIDLTEAEFDDVIDRRQAATQRDKRSMVRANLMRRSVRCGVPVIISSATQIRAVDSWQLALLDRGAGRIFSYLYGNGTRRS